AALAGAILAAIYSFLLTVPMYEATAKLYVLNAGDSAVNLADLQIGTYLASDYQEVFSTWEVHQIVVENLGLSYSPRKMQGMLSISNPKDTRILHIKVTNSSPAEAAAIANEYASVARKFISEKMSTEQPNVLSVALQPTSPSSPNKSRNIMIGFVLGAMLACAVFVVQFLMDDRVRTADDIERYIGLPTLAIVPEQELRAVAQKPRRTERGDRE
ncbi:MAG: capsular polysaccharide biosynthesis protein, partial [Clostridiales bacterium]|nr:capsular polysaccharide biosynthesis protein [Clostridiales bacterium]